MNKPTEELFTCPDCGSPNFTAKGLKAHQGKKRCLSIQAEKGAGWVCAACSGSFSELVAITDSEGPRGVCVGCFNNIRAGIISKKGALTQESEDEPDAAPTHLAALTVFAFKKGDAPFVETFDFAKSLEFRESTSIAWVCPVVGPSYDVAMSEARRAFAAREGLLTHAAVHAGLQFPPRPAASQSEATRVESSSSEQGQVSETGRKLLIVACGKEKADTTAGALPAEDLYVGPLFTARRAFAEASGCPWMILSAKYGLVSPEQALESYDTTIADLTVDDRDEVLQCIILGLIAFFGSEEGIGKGTIEIHGGAEYALLVTEVAEDFSPRIVLPTKGLGQGETMAWYKARATARPLTVAEFENLGPDSATTELAAPLDKFSLVNHYHDLARTSMAQSCAYMILAGVELLALKKDAEYGTWETLFMEGGKSKNAFVFAFTSQSARNYMRLAEAAKKNVPALQKLCEGDTPLALMPPEQREKIVDVVRKAGDGATYKDLAQEWGLAKKPSGNGGGKQESAQSLVLSPQEAAAQAAQDRFHALALDLFAGASEGERVKLLHLPITSDKPGDVTGLADLREHAAAFLALVDEALDQKKAAVRKGKA